MVRTLAAKAITSNKTNSTYVVVEQPQDSRTDLLRTDLRRTDLPRSESGIESEEPESDTDFGRDPPSKSRFSRRFCDGRSDYIYDEPQKHRLLYPSDLPFNKEEAARPPHPYFAPNFWRTAERHFSHFQIRISMTRNDVSIALPTVVAGRDRTLAYYLESPHPTTVRLLT
jgi:hypothetical protein